MIEEVKVPEIGENVESGVVIAVPVRIGEAVAVDTTIVELETDKAVVDIPTPFAGTVTELLVAEADEVAIGDVIAKIDTAATAADDKPAAVTEGATVADQATPVDDAAQSPAEPAPKTAAPVDAPADQAPAPETPPPSSAAEAAAPATPKADMASKRPPAPASPSIRRLARELGVDIYDVNGTGPGGRITDSDVKAFVKASLQAVPATASADLQPPLPDFSRWGDIERVDLTTVRRLTAESTSVSWRAIPHVTQFDEADIQALQSFINDYSPQVQKAGGKLTLTSILIKICAAALKKFPQFNASIDPARRQIIYKHYVHIGMMVATPKGLLVPVIRDVDTKSLTELAVAVSETAARARDRKVRPDELEGGTFSISNQGGIGGTAFTPIVLWPQVAILGVSRSAVKPIFVQDRFEPHPVLPLSLSYDHRIIDGADAARFLRWICEALEQPLRMFLD